MIDIQLFIPCYIDQLYPETGFNVIKVLEKAGCKVHYNPQQTCCGQPAYNSGYWDEARKLAIRFQDIFSSDMPIVSPSGSCSAFVKGHYAKLFQNDADRLALHEKIKPQVFEFSDFLVNYLKTTDLGASFNHKVTFHDSCSAMRELGVKLQPRQLLSKVSGLELVEMEECETCCGFGGTFAVKHNAISAAMVENKVKYALESGAEYIVSTEASCLMNINGYCVKNNLQIKGIHLADVLAHF